MLKKTSPCPVQVTGVHILHHNVGSPSHCGPHPLLVSTSGCLWALCAPSCLRGNLQGKLWDPKTVNCPRELNSGMTCPPRLRQGCLYCRTGSTLPCSGSSSARACSPRGCSQGPAWISLVCRGRVYSYRYSLCPVREWSLATLFTILWLLPRALIW